MIVLKLKVSWCMYCMKSSNDKVYIECFKVYLKAMGFSVMTSKINEYLEIVRHEIVGAEACCRNSEFVDQFGKRRLNLDHSHFFSGLCP